jgi:hypothetical protein
MLDHSFLEKGRGICLFGVVSGTRTSDRELNINLE